MRTVFVCYCIHDARIAHKVAADLEREGLEVELQGHNFRPWHPQVIGFDKALKDDEFGLILISMKTREIEWFCPACRDVLIDESKRGKNRVVPIVAEKLDLPSDIAGFTHVDISESYPRGMAALLGILGVKPGENAKCIRPEQSKAKEGSSQSGRFEIADVRAALKKESAGGAGVVLAFMPRSSDCKTVYSAICAAAKAVGLDARKPGRLPGSRSPSGDNLEMMQSADLIIADLTDAPPDVYFALGHAHCLNKSVITIAREGATLQFDLQKWPHITYTEESGLERDLKETMEALFATPATA